MTLVDSIETAQEIRHFSLIATEFTRWDRDFSAKVERKTLLPDLVGAGAACLLPVS